MKPIVRLCLTCKDPIKEENGRRDRLFCSVKCKNTYHNTQTYLEEQELKRIQLILKKNRRILKKLFIRKDKDELKRDVILKEGFDFDYYTHHRTTFHRNYEYTFCFDYGYRLTKNDNYKIVKAFEEASDD